MEAESSSISRELRGAPPSSLARRMHSDDITSCVSAVDVTLEPLEGAETYVNGKQITECVRLRQGECVSFGKKMCLMSPCLACSDLNNAWTFV